MFAGVSIVALIVVAFVLVTTLLIPSGLEYLPRSQSSDLKQLIRLPCLSRKRLWDLGVFQ